MATTIKIGTMDTVRRGYVGPANADVSVDIGVAIRTDTVVELLPVQPRSEGELPSGLSKEQLIELLGKLEAAPSATNAEKNAIVDKSLKGLGVTADILGIAQWVFSSQAAGLVASAVRLWT